MVDTPERKPHVSVSQINTITNCGEQWRRRYILGQKRPPGVAALVGRGVDQSVDRNLIHKCENDGELLPVDQVMDAARDGLVNEWSGGVLLSPEQAFHGIKKTKGQAADKAVRLARLHHGEFAPGIQPVSSDHIQRRFRVVLPHLSRDLVGIIDIQEADRVRDTKTTGKSPAKMVARDSLQGTAYLLARKALDGLDGGEFVLDYLVDNKRPVAKQYRAGRTKEDFRVLLKRIRSAVELMESGRLIPASPDWWGCSKRWCGYWEDCPYAHGRKLVSLST